MNLGIHITFYYIESRLGYLKKVIEELQKIKYSKTIFIYSNTDFCFKEDHENVKVIVHKFADNGHKKLRKFRRFYCQTLLSLGITKYVHPFYLTWMHRKYVESYVEDYDVQMYLEDDICFDSNSFTYWLKNKDLCIKNNYNLGFFRIEIDEKGVKYLTDITQTPNKIIDIENRKFLLNDVNPYCGFWIYDQKELKSFIKSKEWGFKIKRYGIREKAAIGWHGLTMNRYEGTLIPLIDFDDEKYYTDSGCSIHHLPNNYIGNDVFCQFTSPLIIEK
jgi:hypothetical protein